MADIILFFSRAMRCLRSTCSSVSSLLRNRERPNRLRSREIDSHSFVNEAGMPPHPSLRYRVQQCFKKCGKRSTCTVCKADEAAGECFRVAMQNRRSKLPTTKEELEKAGKTYLGKLFKLIQEEG